MPRKVVVHIGMHKAGSSYIQRLLRENRRQLREAGVRILVNVKEDVTEFTRAVTRAKNRAPNFTPSACSSGSNEATGSTATGISF
jgi:hypothetical protein